RHDRGVRGRDLLSPFRRRQGGRADAASDHCARLRDAVLPNGRCRRALERALATRRRQAARARRPVHRTLRACSRCSRRPQSDRSRIGAEDCRGSRGGPHRSRAARVHRLRRISPFRRRAAAAVGIEAIYIYLRDEYAGCRAILTRELNALASDPPCPLPKIELRRGAGAYICGEESAMIESIEGKRGMPRLRPPYVAQVGLFGRPTLEHNMETLYWVRDILEKGATWFASQGRRERKGLRSFSVSGRVIKPGVHLAPAGISVRELIDEYCGGMLPGHEFYAYLPGGASGGILPASLGDVALDFDTLQPHGCFIGSAAVIILSQHDRARDA